jgi:hypothetical protein
MELAEQKGSLSCHECCMVSGVVVRILDVYRASIIIEYFCEASLMKRKRMESAGIPTLGGCCVTKLRWMCYRYFYGTGVPFYFAPKEIFF